MPKQISNIHDAFFKRVLSDPSLASTFLREHLPPDLAGLLGPETPEPLACAFVDETLREHLSDLLFRVQLKGDREGLVYILIEHKSSPDQGSAALSNKVVREALERLVPHRKERILGPLTQPYYEKGLAEGEAKLLTLLLETRFGALPADFRQRISVADARAIEVWATRAFEARDLQSVFE